LVFALSLLFWLSLVPFVTGWMGENHFAPTPLALYGAILLYVFVALMWLIPDKRIEVIFNNEGI